MTWSQQLETNGFAVIEDVIDHDLADALCAALDNAGYGKRNLLDHPDVLALVTHPDIASIVGDVLGPDAFAVRAILFDKLEGRNWHVGWHQDQAIAIKERAKVNGFGPTSVKDGVPHTRASVQVLEHMLAVRLHLDDCGPDNGPLRCVPGSHTLGRLNPDQSLEHKQRLGEQTCNVSRGGVLLMRPLCLHASSPAKTPRHRRVIHIEFAGCELPDPLAWHERYAIA